MTFFIAGLGNPDEEYALTRHNTGRIILEAFAKKQGFPDFEKNAPAKALVARGKVGTKQVVLIEPDNFMNRSGASVFSVLGGSASKLKTFENLVVIYDDLDLAIGTMKISYNRSSGGHRGLESIIKALKTEAFVRIRIGISPVTPSGKLKKPKGEDAVEKHILGEFKKPELDILKKISKDAVSAIEEIIVGGFAKAMGEYNSA